MSGSTPGRVAAEAREPMSLDDLDLPLGRAVGYPQQLDAQLLRGIPRTPLAGSAFQGADHWTAHEHSWLNSRGRPECGVLQVRVPCLSPAFVESKSLKLYLMSFAMTQWPSAEDVRLQVLRDVAHVCGTDIEVQLRSIDAALPTSPNELLGRCIDGATIDLPDFTARTVLPAVLAGAPLEERLHSNLLRSLCPVTGQPDYATLVIDYAGAPIDTTSMLGYLVGFRTTACFHEQLIEQVYVDVMTHCAPTDLRVMGLFCRRGGIDIVPVRSLAPWDGTPPRGVRQ